MSEFPSDCRRMQKRPGLRYGIAFEESFVQGALMTTNTFSRWDILLKLSRLFTFAIALSLVTPYVSFAAQNPRKAKVVAKSAVKSAAKASAKTVSRVAMATPSKKSSFIARGPAGVSDSQRALEIRGQSRNLSMLLVLKNRQDNIDFVKPRDSYHDEIQKTGF